MLGTPAVATQGRECEKKKKTTEREKGWGCPDQKASIIGLDRRPCPLRCLTQKRARSFSALSSALCVKATPSRLENSRRVSLFGDELGSNHPPSLSYQRQRGEGVLDGRRGLRSLELGSPLRLVQLCSARLLASNLENESRILGVFELQKAEIVIYHNISPHSRPRQPLSHSRQYASPALLGVRKVLAVLQQWASSP